MGIQCAVNRINIPGPDKNCRRAASYSLWHVCFFEGLHQHLQPCCKDNYSRHVSHSKPHKVRPLDTIELVTVDTNKEAVMISKSIWYRKAVGSSTDLPAAGLNASKYQESSLSSPETCFNSSPKSDNGRISWSTKVSQWRYKAHSEFVTRSMQKTWDHDLQNYKLHCCSGPLACQVRVVLIEAFFLLVL